MTSDEQQEPAVPHALVGWRAWRSIPPDRSSSPIGEGLKEWGHSSGGTGLCLVQLDLFAGPIVVLTEIAENADRLAVVLDPGGACDAVWHSVRDLLGDGVDPLSITWILRTGSFSYPDAHDSPEDWSQILPTCEGDRLQATLREIRLLGAFEVSQVIPQWIRASNVAKTVHDLTG